ncbi:MAG: YdeI/OmpD-associated family protein [Chloroflexi bacterium]|nr:YdeI/OmpD-associated family protein [Chloroflexota bacterium]
MVLKDGTPAPDDLARTLEANARGLSAFESLRPSCQMRYVAWIEQARKPETRQRRIGRAMEMALDWEQRHRSQRHKQSSRHQEVDNA